MRTAPYDHVADQAQEHLLDQGPQCPEHARSWEEIKGCHGCEGPPSMHQRAAAIATAEAIRTAQCDPDCTWPYCGIDRYAAAFNAYRQIGYSAYLAEHLAHPLAEHLRAVL